MSTRVRRSPPVLRRSPRQARSRALVEAIVTAGARVLGARGWAGFTTREVAAVAGVGIGSLYQYFPDGTAIVDAVRQRHLDAVLTVLQASSAGFQPPDQRVVVLVDGLIAAHSVEPALHRALLDDLPRGGGPDVDRERFELAHRASYKALVASLRGERAEAIDDLRAQVLSGALEGVIHDAARRGRIALPGLRRELVRLVGAYACEPR